MYLIIKHLDLNWLPLILVCNSSLSCPSENREDGSSSLSAPYCQCIYDATSFNNQFMQEVCALHMEWVTIGAESWEVHTSGASLCKCKKTPSDVHHSTCRCMYGVDSFSFDKKACPPNSRIRPKFWTLHGILFTFHGKIKYHFPESIYHFLWKFASVVLIPQISWY